MSKGVKDEIILKFNGININEYFNQFIDFAELKNHKKFVFKLTLDFMVNVKKFNFIENILSFINSNNINVYYIDRNDINAYISKKLADKHGYANTIYTHLPEKIFNLKELHHFINNKIEYNNLLHKNLKIKKNIFYDENENIETIIQKINEIFELNIKYENIEYKKYIKLNEKQNKFETVTLLDDKYWSI